MLSALLSGLWSRLTGYTIAIGAALAILLAAYHKGGKDAAARTTQARLKSINKAREVEHEVDRLSGDAARDRLSGWMRD